MAATAKMPMRGKGMPMTAPQMKAMMGRLREGSIARGMYDAMMSGKKRK